MKKKKAVNYKKRRVTVIDEQGIEMGNSFSINVSHKYNEMQINGNLFIDF